MPGDIFDRNGKQTQPTPDIPDYEVSKVIDEFRFSLIPQGLEDFFGTATSSIENEIIGETTKKSNKKAKEIAAEKLVITLLIRIILEQSLILGLEETQKCKNRFTILFSTLITHRSFLTAIQPWIVEYVDEKLSKTGSRQKPNVLLNTIKAVITLTNAFNLHPKSKDLQTKLFRAENLQNSNNINQPKKIVVNIIIILIKAFPNNSGLLALFQNITGLEFNESIFTLKSKKNPQEIHEEKLFRQALCEISTEMVKVDVEKSELLQIVQEIHPKPFNTSNGISLISILSSLVILSMIIIFEKFPDKIDALSYPVLHPLPTPERKIKRNFKCIEVIFFDELVKELADRITRAVEKIVDERKTLYPFDLHSVDRISNYLKNSFDSYGMNNVNTNLKNEIITPNKIALINAKINNETFVKAVNIVRRYIELNDKKQLQNLLRLLEMFNNDEIEQAKKLPLKFFICFIAGVIEVIESAHTKE